MLRSETLSLLHLAFDPSHPFIFHTDLAILVAYLRNCAPSSAWALAPESTIGFISPLLFCPALAFLAMAGLASEGTTSVGVVHEFWLVCNRGKLVLPLYFSLFLSISLTPKTDWWHNFNCYILSLLPYITERRTDRRKDAFIQVGQGNLTVPPGPGKIKKF